MKSSVVRSFQDLIMALQAFWAEQGCIILQPVDQQVGAGTFHPATFLKSLGPNSWKAAYVQPSRRPTDGRYGNNPNRLQHYYQFQVVLKPSPINIQDLYLLSLQHIGIDLLIDDIRFVEDNWESPTLGAWGLGWEVWQNGTEISQFTYFQQAGGVICKPILGELTYGLERIAASLFDVDSVYDIPWMKTADHVVTYGDIFQINEQQMSAYNYEHANVSFLDQQFDEYERQVTYLLNVNLPLAAYEMVLMASHVFNLLDARKAISVNERQRYILRVRNMSKIVAENYLLINSSGLDYK